MPMPRPRITGAVSRVTMSPGPRSRIQRAPASCRRSTSSTQSTGSTKIDLGQRCGPVRRRCPGSLGPLGDDVDAVGQPRGVETDLDLHAIEHRAEHRAAAQLVLALGLFLLGDLLQYSSNRDSCSGVPVMTTERRPLRMDSTGGSTVRTSWLNSSQQLGDALGVGVGHRHHRRLVAQADMPRRRATSEPAAPISCSQRQQLDVRAPPALSDSHGQHALRVSGDGHRRVRGQIQALAGQRADGGHLGQQDAGDRHRGRGQLLWRSAPAPRRPARAPSAAARSRPAEPRRVRGRPARAAARPRRPGCSARTRCRPRLTSSSRVSSQALPWPPKTTA